MFYPVVNTGKTWRVLAGLPFAGHSQIFHTALCPETGVSGHRSLSIAGSAANAPPPLDTIFRPMSGWHGFLHPRYRG